MTELQAAHEAYRREVCEWCAKGVRRFEWCYSGQQLRAAYHWAAGTEELDCAALPSDLWADQRDKALLAKIERLTEERDRWKTAFGDQYVKATALAEKLTTGVESPAQESVNV